MKTALKSAPVGSNPTIAPRAGAVATHSAVRPRWASGRYLACLGLLTTAALTMQAAAQWFDLHFRKQPVPLRSALFTLDRSRLGPDFEADPVPRAPLNDETLATLGTRDYLDLRLRSTSRREDDPTRWADVFVSYYTGKPDQVPHVPDECMAAQGFKLVEASFVDIPVNGVGAPGDRIPMRVAVFEAPQSQVRGLLGASLGGKATRKTVMYFFHVNGKYRTTRDQVRLAQANLFERYAYYAKIELSFTDSGGAPAGRDESIAAAAPLLQKLMPMLLADHFADWEALRAGRGNGQARAE